MNLFKKIFGTTPINGRPEPKTDLEENFSLGTADDKNTQPDTITPKIEGKEGFKDLQNPPPYDPSLDLKDYQYPTIDLFSQQTLRFLYDFKNRKRNFLLPVMWSLENGQLSCKDLSELNNVFICGSQETGKTSFLNQIILSLLLIKHPSELKFVIAGSKPLDLRIYEPLEKHFLAKLPGAREAIVEETMQLQKTLDGVCIEMKNRFNLLKAAYTRNVSDYNQKFISRNLNPREGHQYLPTIILIIDDLPGFANYGKELIRPQLEKILNDGYQLGVFACITTHHFGGHSISSNILSLFKQKVVFNLFDKDDYKRVFTIGRVNKFLTKGEFLFNEEATVSAGFSIEFQYPEIERVVKHIGDQRGYPQAFLLPESVHELKSAREDLNYSDVDPLFEDAARVIVMSQVGSTSLLQRRMKLGYNRAGRLMDQLEAAGIVGPFQGANARVVLIKTEQELNSFLERLR